MAKSKTEAELQIQNRVAEHSNISNKSQTIVQRFQSLLQKYQILNFMLVGGIGYALNMLVYWPLTLVFKNDVTFLGQHFYLPPFVISSLLAILCNYELNRIWTFKGWKKQRFAGARYLSMALATLLIDMLFLFILVQFFKLPPVPAAALAILIVFIIRYTIARSWVWSKKS
jgi:putative flippase GtrA